MTSIKSIIKKTLLAIAITLPTAASAQNPILSKSAKLQDVEYSYLSSAMLSKADELPQTGNYITEILSELKSIEVLVCDENAESYRKIVEDIKPLYEPMELISQVQDSGDTTQIFGKPGKSSSSDGTYTEILFIKDETDIEEITVILFNGNIKPASIKNLVND